MRRVLTAVLAMVCVTALVGVAEAGQRINSKVTIEYQPDPGRFGGSGERRVDAFGGNVESNEVSCVDSRKVILFKQRHRNAQPRKVGSDIAAVTGQWGVEVSPAPNVRFYFAKIREAETQGGTCKADRSRKIEFLTR